MTTYPLVRLEAPGLTTLVIDEALGYFGDKLDLGDPETRVVVHDTPDADGTDDTTMFTGARTVTLSVLILPNPGDSLAAMRQRLRAFTSPRLRPIMYVQATADAPTQRLVLRRSQYSDVIGDEIRSANMRDPVAAKVTVQWVAASGIIESADEHTALVYAAGSVTAGRTYSLTFSRVYPASQALGTASVTNAGTTDAYPLLRLYGPMTEPVFDNITQGRSLTFVGLTIAAGDYVEIDTRTKTITLNGDPANSRYDKLSFPTSRWWTLSPGVNLLRLHPATFTDGTSVAVVTWRDAYL